MESPNVPAEDTADVTEPFEADPHIARDNLTQGDFGWHLFGWAIRRHLPREFAGGPNGL